MKQAKIKPEDRKVVTPCLERAQALNAPAAAIELRRNHCHRKNQQPVRRFRRSPVKCHQGTGRNPHDTHLIAPSAIEPIQTLKTTYLGSKNPRLHTDEVLIALSMSAATDPVAKKALGQLPKLQGCQVHTSVMLSNVDIKTFKKLGMNLTSEPVYEHKKLYH